MLSFLKPPIFLKEEQTQTARLLYIILWVGMAAVTLIVISNLFFDPANWLRWLLTIVFVDVVGVAMVLLNRRGFTRLASIGLITSLWLIFTTLAVTGGGLRAPAMTAYFVLVPLAGLLLGGNSVILAGIGYVLTGLVLLAAGKAGILPAGAVDVTPALLLAAYSLYIIMIVAVQYLSTKTLKDALARAWHEIVERKHAEAALRQGEAALRAYLDVAPVAMAWYKLDGVIEFTNRKSTELFGYTIDEIRTPEKWFELAYPDPEYRQKLATVWQAAVSEAQRTGNEIPPVPATVTCKDGSTRYVEISGAVVDGRILVAFTDLTDREHTEKALQESEERFRTLIEKAPVAINVTRSGKVVYANPYYLRLFGFDNLVEIEGHSVLEHVAPASRGDIARRIRSRDQGQPLETEFEATGLQKNGSLFPYHGATSTVDFPGGEATIGFFSDISARKQVEDKLRQSEQRYREVFDATSNGIFLIDVTPDNRFIYVAFNPAEKGMTGLSEAMYGQSTDDCLSPEVAEAVNAKYMRCVETGETMSYKERLVLPVGSKDFNTTLMPVRDPAGRIYRIVGIANDITQNKRAEADHQERLARAEMLAAVSQTLVDVSLDYVAALDVIARQVSHEIGDTCVVFLVSEDGEYLTATTIHHRDTQAEEFIQYLADHHTIKFGSGLVGRVAQTGQPIVLNEGYSDQVQSMLLPGMVAYQNRLGIGSILDVPMRAQGSTMGVLSLIRHQVDRPYTAEDQALVQELADRAALTITNARLYAENMRQAGLLRQANAELEERIAERTAELADLYNNAPCGYQSLDEDGRFLRINETGLKMYGYSREELIGKRIDEILTPNFQEKFKAEFRGVKGLEALNNTESEVIRKDGSVLPILVSAMAEKDAAGRFSRSRATVVDNTGRKETEAQIQKLNTELAARAQKLEMINKELESFSYTVSHDLKAPLRGINGYSRLLLEDYAARLDEEGRFFLESIRKASIQMGQLIDDLLTYSRLERRPMNATRVELQPFVEGLLAQYADEIQSRHVALAVTLPPVILQVDPDGLGMALRNILDNAIKYTRNVLSPVIEIGGEETARACRVWIKDNGIGFDMQYHDRIFEIFQRLGQDEEYPGTGIGLALVRKAIQRTGGRVWAESKPGEGATFFLEIPK